MLIGFIKIACFKKKKKRDILQKQAGGRWRFTDVAGFGDKFMKYISVNSSDFHSRPVTVFVFLTSDVARKHLKAKNQWNTKSLKKHWVVVQDDLKNKDQFIFWGDTLSEGEN